MDASKLAGSAVASAAAAARPAKGSSNYKDLAGPFETAGGHGDAFLVESPSGVVYLENRPRGTGRVKRVPLTAVAAVFPQILPPDTGGEKGEKAGGKK